MLYLGLGFLFEYGLKIPMGFYSIPIVVVFLIALYVACCQNRALPLEEKLTLMGKGVGDKNIIIMVLIFLTAGLFVGVVGRSSADSVAYFLLSIIPPQFAVAVLFVVSSCLPGRQAPRWNHITSSPPIAALAGGWGPQLFPSVCVAAVLGGGMFGDNLSFISDTTIAACNGQGCPMKDKFRVNFAIALPAALVTLGLLLLCSAGQSGVQPVVGAALIQILPYLLVLVGGILGFNVFLVLVVGIVSGSFIMLATGVTAPTDLLANMGSGAAGMYETAMVAILVSAMGALIRAYGGFDALLYGVKKVFRGRKGGQLGMGLLVGAMDVATANNTVAIVMANPIAKEMAQDYGISARKAASLLDTFSCIFQGILPYGAQMLVALSAASELGFSLSAFQIIPYLFYPFLLLVSSLLFIFVFPERELDRR